MGRLRHRSTVPELGSYCMPKFGLDGSNANTSPRTPSPNAET